MIITFWKWLIWSSHSESDRHDHHILNLIDMITPIWIWSTWSPHSESDQYVMIRLLARRKLGEKQTPPPLSQPTIVIRLKEGSDQKWGGSFLFLLKYIVFSLHFELRLSGPWQSENEGRDAGGRISWPSVHLHTAQESNHANYFSKSGQITCNIYSRIQILIKYFSGNFCHQHKTDGTKASKVQKLLPCPTMARDHDGPLFFQPVTLNLHDTEFHYQLSLALPIFGLTLSTCTCTLHLPTSGMVPHWSISVPFLVRNSGEEFHSQTGSISAPLTPRIRDDYFVSLLPIIC